MGCASSSTLEFAPPEQPAGYPVFINTRFGGCAYQVQDMILTGKELADWLMGLLDKSWRIDIVVEEGRGSCVNRAARYVRNAGFSDIVLRQRGDVAYPSGLPPR